MRIWLIALCLLTGMRAGFGADFVALVAGRDSDNTVSFDLATGRSKTLVRLPPGSAPRGIAVDFEGDVYLTLNGADQNVVRLVPGPAGGLWGRGLTEPIGRFGPGHIRVHHSGDLLVAGDEASSLIRFSPGTGAVSGVLPLPEPGHFRGLLVRGDEVLLAAYFDNTILSLNLRGNPVEAELRVPATDELDRPLGMAFGHNGNIFVTSARHSRIVEFDSKSGEPAGTFADLARAGLDGISDIAFEPHLHHYFVASGDGIYKIDTRGNLRASFHDPDLKNAAALTVIHESNLSTLIRYAD